jgi:hypothetical protein
VPVMPLAAGAPADNTIKDVARPAVRRHGRDAAAGTTAKDPDVRSFPKPGAGDESRGE